MATRLSPPYNVLPSLTPNSKTAFHDTACKVTSVRGNAPEPLAAGSTSLESQVSLHVPYLSPRIGNGGFY